MEKYPVQRAALWTLATLVTLLLAACGSRPATLAADSQLLQTGQALYNTHCAACHQLNGEGEQNWKVPDANGIYPAPPHDSSGHTWHHADEVLLQVIREGGSMPNSKMPAYGEILSQPEMEAVLAYIKTFWGADEAAFQRQVTTQGKEESR